MPINEYDDMLTKETVADKGNEYFGMVQDEVANQKTALKTSMFSASKMEPDRQAKVIDLANKTKLPTSVVERNFDEISMNHAADIDYDDLIRSSPKVSEWLQDPNNAGVSHDDIPALRNIEDTVKEFGMLDTMYRSLNVGAANLLSNLAKTPAALTNAILLPYNLTVSRYSKRPDLQVMFPTDNAISHYYENAAEAYKTPEMEASIVGEIKAGNYAKAGRALAAQFVANSPTQAAIIMGTLSGYGLPTLAGAGAVQGASAMAEAQKKGAAPVAATVDALLQGTIEAGFEQIGTFGILKTWESAIAKQYGKEVSKQIFKDFSKTLVYSMAGEGNEEFLTQIAQDYSDYITGVNPDAMKGTLARALNAGIIGGVSGGLMTGPSAITAGASRGAQMRQSTLAKDFYVALGNSIEATKTKTRLPQATRTLVETITKDSPVENIYVSPEVVDKYFEQAKINPVQMMQDLGTLEAYNEAKQTGGDVKIPLSTWAEKIVGTEYYQGLANDIKFSPDAMSVNETTKLSEEMKTESDKATVQKPSTVEQESGQVAGIIEEQLKVAGRPAQEAKISSQLYEARLRTRAVLRGESPLELYKREGLEIKQPVALTEGMPGKVLEQPPISITPEAKALEEKALTEFGQTPDFEKAGFVLSDGRMIDFTKGGEARIYMHANIEQVYKGTGNTGDLQQFMKETGAVRLSQYDDIGGRHVSIESQGTLSQDQLKQVTEYFDTHPMESTVFEVVNDIGKPIRHKAVANPTGEDVARFFNGTSLYQSPIQKSGEEEARGRILFGEGKINIELLKTADQSTFLHETGHLWLNEVGQDLAHIKSLDEKSLTPQQRQFIKDSETSLEWLGAQSFDQLTTEQHEQWARGFEAYLMEGKAPTTALRRAFANFKVWLINIYRQMKSLNVQLTDDVRGVMDRLLASDEEINAAEAQQKMQPLFVDPKAVGMSDAKADAYLNATFWARKSAEEEINTKLMKEFNRAKESWYKEQRMEVKKEIETNVAQERVYRNIDQLKEGAEMNGTPFKLGREGIDPAMIKRLPRGILSPKGKEGLHVNIVAEMLGYESADQLLLTLANAPKKEALINRLTDERMQQLYPDTMLNNTLSDEAMKAVHNEKRTQLLRLELEHLMSDDMPVYKEAIRRIVRRVPTQEAVRQTAHEIVGGRLVKDVRPYPYQLAESKSAKEAGIALAKGDINAAFEAKQRELLNHELYRTAVEAQETIDDAMDLFKKLSKSDEVLAKTRDVDLVNAARAILADYGIGMTDKTALDYIEPIRRYDPDTYNAVSTLITSATQVKGDYKSIKFDDFVAVKDSIEALWNLSRIQEQIEIDGKKMDREQVRLELGARLEDLIKPGNRTGYNHAATTWEKTKMYLLGTKASLRRVETWVDAMDGGEPNGVFRKYVWNPISESATEYRIAKKEYLQKYLDIVKSVEKSLTVKEIDAPELEYKFASKAELLGTILHSGNESNLSKLLRGRGWGQMDEEGILDTSRWDAFIQRMWDEKILAKEDYDFAQNVWNLLEELKPQAQKAHKGMYGYYFNEITTKEINTPFGIYKGGYVPAVVDPFASSDAAIRNEREDLEKNNNSYMFPTTGRGFTKSRVDAYAAPMALDLRYVPSHIDKVLRFVHIEPHVKDVGRIIMDKSFRHDLDLLDPTIGGDMLVPWLQRTGQQKIQTPSNGWGGRAADNFFRELRTRTGFQVMTASVSNALQQFTGLSIAAIKVKPGYLRDSLWAYVRGPRVLTAQVNEKSPFMSTRTTTQAMEVMQTIDDLLINPTKYEKARAFAKKHGYFMQQGTQNVVDVVAWSGAYDQAVAEGAAEQEAVRRADSAVRETQGSFNPEDISRFETGSAFQRAFTQFYSYFNMQANLYGTEFATVARNLGLKKGAGRLLFVYAMGLMIPSVISELIFRAMSGKGLDEDDDDQYMDDAMSIFFGSQLKTATAMIPFAGQIINSGINTFNKKWYDDRITVSPAITMIEAAVKAPSEIYRTIVDDAKAAPAVRDTLTLLGLLTGLPLAPLAKPINYLSAVKSGEAEPTGPIDFARGLVSGKPGRK